MRWSHLRQLLLEKFDPKLDVDIYCTVIRGKSVSVGKYWIVFNQRTIWEVPARSSQDVQNERANPVASEVTLALREYLEISAEQLFERALTNDRWGLSEILRVLDRRIGKRRLELLLKAETPQTIREIIEQRLKENSLEGQS